MLKVSVVGSTITFPFESVTRRKAPMLPLPSGLGSVGMTSHSLPPGTLVPTKFTMRSRVVTRSARTLAPVWLYSVKLKLILCCTWALALATKPRTATPAMINAFNNFFIVFVLAVLAATTAHLASPDGNVQHSCGLIRVLLDNLAWLHSDSSWGFQT